MRWDYGGGEESKRYSNNWPLDLFYMGVTSAINCSTAQFGRFVQTLRPNNAAVIADTLLSALHSSL